MADCGEETQESIHAELADAQPLNQEIFEGVKEIPDLLTKVRETIDETLTKMDCGACWCRTGSHSGNGSKDRVLPQPCAPSEPNAACSQSDGRLLRIDTGAAIGTNPAGTPPDPPGGGSPHIWRVGTLAQVGRLYDRVRPPCSSLQQDREVWARG